MKKIISILCISIAIVSCKKEETKSMEGLYTGKLVLTTVRNDVPYSNEFESAITVEFKGNKNILIPSFYTEKIPFNTSQKTFRKQQGDSAYYYGYFVEDSLFLEFNGGKSGTTYFYSLQKNL